jgi:hypothetical protein
VAAVVVVAVLAAAADSAAAASVVVATSAVEAALVVAASIGVAGMPAVRAVVKSPKVPAVALPLKDLVEGLLRWALRAVRRLEDPGAMERP